MSRTVYITIIFFAIIICLLLNLSNTNQCYGEITEPKKYLKKEYRSPEGNIIVRHYGESIDDNSADIWLYSAKHPSKRAMLYSYDGDANVLFSHNEKWLVLNHRYGSDGTNAILFKKIKGLKYEQITSLNDFVWDLFKKTHKQYKIPEFDHSYTYAVFWSSDSKSVMLRTYGHDDLSPTMLDPWFCIYDVTTGKMSLDFNRVFNRDTYHPDGKAKGRELYLD
ncbi:MAG: hypothetical protein H7843_03025 [Nitrospirota bacterium]